MNKETRSEKVMVRIEPSLLKECQDIAEKLGVNGTGALAHKLLKEYAKASKQHGDNLPWPPRFEYFTYAETSQTKKDERGGLEQAG